jgi:hypothetical protein
MRERDPRDNTYEEGTRITAKENPNLQLIITKYSQRIYYCAAVNDTTGKMYAYFERNLIPPTQAE